MDGDKLSFSNDNIVIKDLNNKVKNQMTFHLLFSIFVVGGYTLTSKLVEEAKKYGVSIYLLNTSLKPVGEFSSALESNTILRKKQYLLSNELDISKKIIKNKINNQKEALKRIRNNHKDLNKYLLKIDKVKTIEELMGIEGMCAKLYFNNMFDKIAWKRRAPRTKEDIVNFLLDIGYTFLFNFVDANLKMYGFDLYKGNLHQEFYKRKSLVCDLVEPFRPLVDLKVRKMFNLNQIDTGDFIYKNGMYSLKINCNQKYSSEFLKLIYENRNIIFEYIKKYYYWNMNNENSFPEAEI